MNIEWLQGTLAAVNMVVLAVSSFLYMWGGRQQKFVRRFIAPSLITTSLMVSLLFLGNFNWLHLAVYPILCLTWSLGYGGTDVSTKVIKRTIVALAACGAGLLMCLTLGGNAWLILPVQVILSFLTIFFAVKNPLYAASEEVFVCMLQGLALMVYPFVVK